VEKTLAKASLENTDAFSTFPQCGDGDSLFFFHGLQTNNSDDKTVKRRG
jgi:hypothetical protein